MRNESAEESYGVDACRWFGNRHVESGREDDGESGG